MFFSQSRLPPVFSQNRRIMLVGIVLSALLQSALAIVIAFQTREIFAAFAASQGAPAIPLAILLSAGLLILFLRVSELALGDMLGYDYVKTLRVKLFDHISRLSTDTLQNHKQGSLQIRFVGDLTAMQNWVGQAIPGILSAIVLMPGLLYLLYWLHPTMAAVGLLLAISCILLMHITGLRLRDVHQDVRSKRGGLASFVSARLNNAPLLRTMGLRAKLSEQILRKSESLQASAVRKSVVVNSFKGFPDVFLQLLYLCCILLAFHYQLTAAEAAVILAIIAIFHQPFKSVAEFWDKRNAFLVSRRKCTQLLSTRTVSKGKKLSIKQDDIDDVTIQTHQLSISNIQFPDLVLNPNQHTLIAGYSGSGKSSFLQVLLGLRAPQAGNLSINKTPAAQLTETSRKRLFSYIGDEVPIFASTLKNNLLLGSAKSTDIKLIEQASHMFGLTSLLNRLGGLDGYVNEHGNNLSKGEIMRIACCRAWLSNAKFVLIDDIDALVTLTDERVINCFKEQATSKLIACSRHPYKWRSIFDRVYPLTNENSDISNLELLAS